MPVRPRLWPVVLAYALVWLVVAAAAVALALRARADAVSSTEKALPLNVLGRIGHDVLHRPGFLIDVVWVATAALLAMAVVIGLWSARPFVERLALGTPAGGLWRGLAWTLAGTLGAALAGLVASALVDARGALVAALSPQDAPWLIAAFAPCAEEIFFRGAVQTRLEARWGRGAAPIVATAAAAALLHVDPRQMFFVLVFGAALGALRAKTGSLWPSLAAHVANNAAWVLLA